MKSLSNIILLLLIPFLISLNWLIGGNLVKILPPMTLAASRMLLATMVLFFFSNILQAQINWSKTRKISWWKEQFVLSFTGRACYSVFSIYALTMISPFAALVIASLLPVFLILIERLGGKSFKNKYVPSFAFLSTIITLATLNFIPSLESSLGNISYRGLLCMGVAIFLFAIHLTFYKRTIRDDSSSNPLFAQFLIAAILVISIEPLSLLKIFQLTLKEWFQLLMYSIVCNLIPFALVHYSLKKYSPLIIGSVSILSPLFAFIFKGIYTSISIPWIFIILTILASFFVFMTIKFDKEVV
ncbi:MAG: DMT family transporter [Bacteriovoracaceae bacterium]